MELEGIAKKYAPNSRQEDFDWWLIQFDFETLNKFLKGERVIELGCGRGILTEKLARACREVVTVEGSQQNIRYVRGKLTNCLNIEFRHALWQEFEYEGHDVSDVVFFMGLEHLHRRDALRVLKRIKRFLESDGRLHIVVPNAFSLHRRVAYYMDIIEDVHDFSERDKLFGHKRVYDRETLFQELKRCGYKILHWEGIFLKPLPNAMMMDLDEKIIRGLYEIGKEMPDYCAHIYVVCEK